MGKRKGKDAEATVPALKALKSPKLSAKYALYFSFAAFSFYREPKDNKAQEVVHG